MLINLCRAPGHEAEKLQYLEDFLSTAASSNHSIACGLEEDIHRHTAAFYALVQQRTAMLKLILEHEKTWYAFFSFIQLIHEESLREVYQETQPSYDIFRR